MFIGEKRPERAFLYARSATGDQRSLEAQLAAMRQRAAKESYAIVGEVIEASCSGNSSDRPGLNDIFDHAQEPREFDVLIIAEHTRLARDIAATFAIIDKLRKRGIRSEDVDNDLLNDRLHETTSEKVFISPAGRSDREIAFGGQGGRHEGR